MKQLSVCALILFSLSLPAFAARNSASISIESPVTVGTTQVAAGDYTVSWTGADANVQVSLARDGKTLVTVPAKLVQAKNGYTSLDTKTDNGVTVVEEIMLDKLTLDLSAAQ